MGERPQLQSDFDALKHDLDRLEALLKVVKMPVRDGESAIQDARKHLEALRQGLEAEQGVPQSGLKMDQDRLAALYRLSHTLGTSLDLDEVLTQTMDAVIELTGAERGFLMLMDAQTQKFIVRAARNIGQAPLEAVASREMMTFSPDTEGGTGSLMGVSRSVVKAALESTKGVITTNAQADKRFSNRESILLHDLRSIMCTPLRSRGRLIGVVYVDNRIRTGVFTEADLELLNAFASQAAIALENASLYTDVEQNLKAHIAELETLAQVDHDLTVKLDFDHVVETTFRYAMKCAVADSGFIALRESTDGKPPTAETPLRVVAGRGKGNLIPAIKPDLPAEGCLTPAGEKNPATLTIPLQVRGTTIGMLRVERQSNFSEKEISFLRRFLTHAALAIENARLYQAVQTANQAKSKFVSVVVHELRIPMTSIKGYTDLLRQGAAGEVTEMQKDFLNVIRNNVDRMAALVADLSDISRIETGRLKLEPVETDLKKHIEEVVNSLAQEMEAKKQTLVIDVAADLPRVYADPRRVVQILNNLVSNAWKYTPEEGKITIRAVSVGERVQVEISDTGIGITPVEQEKLFTQFFRSENPAVSEQPGWGLGLHVTRSLVEIMNGEIGVQSEPGKGSTFWFTLPCSA